MSSTSRKLIKKGPGSCQNQSKITPNWTFLATYTPDVVTIWPHMACLPMFLSHTTYTGHILPHMGSNGRQIFIKRGFSGENLPCSRFQKFTLRPFFDLDPCPIHQNDQIVHSYNLYNSDLLKSQKGKKSASISMKNGWFLPTWDKGNLKNLGQFLWSHKLTYSVQAS